MGTLVPERRNHPVIFWATAWNLCNEGAIIHKCFSLFQIPFSVSSCMFPDSRSTWFGSDSCFRLIMWTTRVVCVITSTVLNCSTHGCAQYATIMQSSFTDQFWEAAWCFYYLLNQRLLLLLWSGLLRHLQGEKGEKVCVSCTSCLFYPLNVLHLGRVQLLYMIDKSRERLWFPFNFQLQDVVCQLTYIGVERSEGDFPAELPPSHS